MKKTAYSYIRWSSEKQRDNDSLRRQIASRDRWLQQHPEYQLDQTISLKDESVSSFRGRNIDKEFGDLGRFMALAASENSPIPPDSVLLVERLDRFSRAGAMTAYTAIVQIVMTGIKVVIIEEGIEITKENFNDLPVILPAIVNLCLAHDESAKKSSHISNAWEGHRKKVENGEAIYSHQIPAWIEIDQKTKKPVLINAKADIVKYIFKRTIEGIGQKLLCKELNQKHKPITSPKLNKQTGKYSTPKWNTSYLCDLLQNRQVLGELQPRKRNANGKYEPIGPPIEGYFPPVIEPKMFYAARLAIAQKKKEKYQDSSKFVNLLTGLVFNGADKRKMHLITTRVIRNGGKEYRQRRFQSHGKNDGIAGVSPLSVDYYALEKLVLLSLTELDKEEMLGDFKPNLEKAKLLQAISGYKNRLKELERILSDPKTNAPVVEIVEAINKLKVLLERDQAEFDSLNAIPEKKIAKLKDITEVQKLFSSFNEGLDINTRYETRRMIATLIKRIVVFPYKRKNRMVAARVGVLLRAENKIRMIILMPDKRTKRFPEMTFYGKNDTPAIALCNVGLVYWEKEHDGDSGNWQSINDLRSGRFRFGTKPLSKTGEKEMEVLQRNIFFYEEEFFKSTKGGDFADPWMPSKKMIDVFQKRARMIAGLETTKENSQDELC